MSFCEGCKYQEGEDYCILFDDVLFFEDCVFREKEE